MMVSLTEYPRIVSRAATVAVVTSLPVAAWTATVSPTSCTRAAMAGRANLNSKRQEMYRIIAAMATIIAISAFLPVSRTKLCIQITQHRLVLSLAQCLSLYQLGIVSNRLDGCSRHTICFHNLPNLVNAGGLVQLDFRPHTTLELNAQAYARTNDHNQSEQQDGQE